MLVIERNSERNLTAWSDVNWTATEANVRNLQDRIFRATKAKDFRTVRNLQKLLVRSTSAKLKAIRRVTQENDGRHTPGIDGVVCNTSTSRLLLLKSGLNLRGYKPLPVRRVYIPKASGGQRSLGIPTVKDRIMQAIVKMALEPEWECRFEPNSYGFRPGRSCHDAVTALHTTMCKSGSSEWALDADISKCFDNIDHDVLLQRLPIFKATIKRWLKAGSVELGQLSPSEAGTPQGGIISPLLANIALDGMEKLFGFETRNGHYIGPSERSGANKGISLIRYADDFVILAPSREVLETYALPQVASFLAARGLHLNELKTRIVHIEAGFNFLGFEIRRFPDGVLLTRPAKDKVLAHLDTLRAYLRTHQQARASQVVKDLTPIVRGWVHFYHHGASAETFKTASHRLWVMLWTWAKRRHPNKSRYWIKRRYFTEDWTFYADNGASLRRHHEYPVTRFPKVAGRNSPLDPDLRAYWERRKMQQVALRAYRKSRQTMLRRQGNACAHCGITFWPGDTIHDHHLVPRNMAGSDDLSNRVLVHAWCHRSYHERHGYKVAEA